MIIDTLRNSLKLMEVRLLLFIYDRGFHKKWLLSDRMDWYYDHFPENWADKLGGVDER